MFIHKADLTSKRGLIIFFIYLFLLGDHKQKFTNLYFWAITNWIFLSHRYLKYQLILDETTS